MSSNPAFPFNAWVWVKQPDYPWWPAVVLDPAQSGQQLPEGCDLVLLCGPTAAATLAFASSHDPAQVRPFRGAEVDDVFVKEGRGDESCGAAIEEMVAAVAAASGSSTQPAPSPESTNVNNAGDVDEAVSWEALLADTAAAAEAPSRDKAEKKHKKDKRKKKEKSKKAKKAEKTHTRHRARHGGASLSEGEEEAAGSSSNNSNDSDDEDGDDDLFRRRNGTASTRTAAKKMRYERQSRLDEYKAGSARPLTHHAPHYDPDYLHRKVRNARRSASNEELVRAAAELRELTRRCLSGAATSVELEEEVLRVLSPLARVDVTVAQLQESGVGVAVGSLLRGFTTAVHQLAQAILNYWFRTLPQNTQQQLSAETEVDRASVDTCASGGSGDEGEGTLGRLGVMLYDSFTNQEIDDAPPSAKVVKLCKLIEAALMQHCSLDAQRLVLSAFGDEGSTGKSLRRFVLEGKITADDIVKHADELPTLIRSNQRRPTNILTHTSNFSMNIGVGGGSPTSPNELFSPIGDGSVGSPTFGSPTGRASTALYTCPQCGANDAYQSSYTVQAHDNMPDILRCKKCGSTWNVADQ
ncbi:hypothetical protein ABB37_02364 [Leptomonas pyrrhocoris]|uniref:PWWP domain-containing protein n=1 Tax=Leptomonas pyrrhocoris TaxID=157538 RepID=A0A0M9G7N6_LEPPY|nr:hypothetical protein ABB37_02364 [Leptomonas pyrrhocoris]KPA84370.1 hypothetical protein ABB37_02364 [Leptomonas pyrrhocoris]|eukprot:XP_015662809.1 hypothetical protein ABB37_02364 [Leptomonas pyrrhocoris]